MVAPTAFGFNEQAAQVRGTGNRGSRLDVGRTGGGGVESLCRCRMLLGFRPSPPPRLPWHPALTQLAAHDALPSSPRTTALCTRPRSRARATS